jgi:hypothetical protein
MVFTLNTEPPVDSTEQRILVHQAADGAARGVIDAGDAAGPDGEVLLLAQGGRRDERGGDGCGQRDYELLHGFLLWRGLWCVADSTRRA